MIKEVLSAWIHKIITTDMRVTGELALLCRCGKNSTANYLTAQVFYFFCSSVFFIPYKFGFILNLFSPFFKIKIIKVKNEAYTKNKSSLFSTFFSLLAFLHKPGDALSEKSPKSDGDTSKLNTINVCFGFFWYVYKNLVLATTTTRKY